MDSDVRPYRKHFCRMHKPVVAVCRDFDFIVHAFKDNGNDVALHKTFCRVGQLDVFRPYHYVDGLLPAETCVNAGDFYA